MKEGPIILRETKGKIELVELRYDVSRNRC